MVAADGDQLRTGFEHMQRLSIGVLQHLLWLAALVEHVAIVDHGQPIEPGSKFHGQTSPQESRGGAA
jgi:hypothetical protein